MIAERFDIGAVAGIYRKDLFLHITSGGVRYILAVGGRTLSLSAVRAGDGYGYSSVSLETIPAVIAHALQRAICRGIDRCEIVETERSVIIDLGTMAGLP